MIFRPRQQLNQLVELFVFATGWGPFFSSGVPSGAGTSGAGYCGRAPGRIKCRRHPGRGLQLVAAACRAEFIADGIRGRDLQLVAAACRAELIADGIRGRDLEATFLRKQGAHNVQGPLATGSPAITKAASRAKPQQGERAQ